MTKNSEDGLAKAETVAAKMETRRLKAAADCLREGIGETTTYLLGEFPLEPQDQAAHEQHDRTAGP